MCVYVCMQCVWRVCVCEEVKQLEVGIGLSKHGVLIWIGPKNSCCTNHRYRLQWPPQIVVKLQVFHLPYDVKRECCFRPRQTIRMCGPAGTRTYTSGINVSTAY